MEPVVLVTGSTDGIGRATAANLAASGATVVVHGRDPRRVEATVADIDSAAPDRVAGGIVADLADRDAVEHLADAARDHGVTVLVNNAGIYARERVETADGREVTWTVNHLHPTLLTVLLLDDLLDTGGRVVNVSAVVHGRARLDLDDPEFRTRRYSHFHAYANSKLANLLMAKEFARRVGPDGPVTFNAVHPGVVSTKLLTEGMQVSGHDEPAVAAAEITRLALDPGLATVTGAYFAGGEQTSPSGPGADEELAARLYDMTMAQLGFD